MPKIADFAVWMAAVKAMPALRKKRPLRLLLDSTIHAHSITHDEAWIDTGQKLWGGVHRVQTGYIARVPIFSPSNKTRQYRDICHLTVLRGLTQRGLFELFTSSELMAERTRHPPSLFGTTHYSDFSLLDGLKIESLDGWTFDGLISGEATTAELSNIQRNRIASAQDELYTKILKIFGSDKHSQDAWHIRTAQIHDIHILLTMDYKLVRMVHTHRDRLSRAGVSVKVLTPAQLGEDLNFGRVPPHLFSYNDASFPVRADLHMPHERRKKSNSRR